MELYSLENAQYLKNYYSLKVINKIADEKTGLRITSIELEQVNNDLYNLNCCGYLINNISIVTKMSIKTTAEFMNLKSPEFVLQRRDQ